MAQLLFASCINVMFSLEVPVPYLYIKLVIVILR